jgi:predicted amidohydrolase
MPRNTTPTDDPIARTLAENELADVIGGTGAAADHVQALTIARAVVAHFPVVALDKQRSHVVGGETVALRRITFAGSWEVDPNTPTADGER